MTLKLPPRQLPPRLGQALARLHQGLDQIEAAVERQGEFAEVRANLQEELAIMQDDRSRLAVQLDGALGRARTLELANTEVSQRLARIGGVIGHALGQADEAAGEDGASDLVDDDAADDAPRPAGVSGTAES